MSFLSWWSSKLSRKSRSTTLSKRNRREKFLRGSRSLRMEQLEGRALLASLVTDALDYHPGQTVYLTASEFSVGEPVSFQVTSSTAGPGQEPWIVADGIIDGGDGDLDGLPNGSVSTTWLCDPAGAYAGATLTATALGLSSGESASAVFTDSAIFTSNFDGTNINQNIYDAKTDVYFTGGPGPSALAVGDYYFQVNTPDGDLLSTDTQADRAFHVNASGEVDSATHATYTKLSGGLTFQLAPFADTTNAGGEYQLSVISKADYDDNIAHGKAGFKGAHLQDNFKVDAGDPPVPPTSAVTVLVHKFNDINGDGDQDEGEPNLAWDFNVTIGSYSTTVTTDSVSGSATVSTDVLDSALAAEGGVAWSASEVLVGGWTPTTDVGTSGIFDTTNTSGDLDVGNFDNIEICGVKFQDHTGNGFAVGNTLTPPTTSFTIYLYQETNGNPGLQTVAVGLVPADSQIATTTTAGDDPLTPLVNEAGPYCFTNGGEGYGPGTYYTIEGAGATDAANWIQTGTQGGTIVASSGSDSSGNNFANAHLGTQGGLTIGFYSNSNGQALLCTPGARGPTTVVKPEIVSYLQATLAKGDGTNSVLVNSSVSGKITTYNYIPLTSLSSYTVLQNFLKSANATNMAHMLSAQLLATVLNSGNAAGVTSLANTGISTSSIIYVGNVTTVGGAAGQSNAQIQTALEVGGTATNAPGVLNSSVDDFVSVSELIAAAKKELCTNKITIASSADRTYQEALKNCFDAMNQSAPTLKQNIFVL